MRRCFTIRLLVAVLISSLFVSCINDDEIAERECAIGDRLPDFSVTMSDGTSVSGASLRETASLILFFHSSCPDCQQVLPIIQRIYDEYASAEIQFAFISREEDATTIATYWESQNFTMPYSAQANRNIYELFATSRIPRVYISDSEGIIRYIFTDNPVPTYEELASALDEQL